MKILESLKVQNIKVTILVQLCLIYLHTLGQGVPKAYEEINYQGKVNGQAGQIYASQSGISEQVR